MSTSLEISPDKWDAYVEASPGASIYHKCAWRTVISETFGKPCFYIAHLGDDAAVDGLLPLVRLNGPLTPDTLISLPYCSFGGVLADNDTVALELLHEAQQLAMDLKCDIAEVRSNKRFEADDWRPRDDKVRMVLSLPVSVDDLGRSIGSKRRAQIKRPQRENPEIQFGGAELIPSFYGVFAKKMRDLGTPVYPISFFHNVAKFLGDAVRVVIVFISGKVAAAAVLIRHHDEVEIPWAASDREFDRIAVNMLLYWEAVSYAIESGGKTFDFGRCTRDSGTYKFKRQWGAEPVELGWQRWMRKAPDSLDASPGRSAEALSNVWKKLPLPVANWLGPKVTANLPW